jgi:hypothetical protein
MLRNGRWRVDGDGWSAEGWLPDARWAVVRLDGEIRLKLREGGWKERLRSVQCDGCYGYGCDCRGYLRTRMAVRGLAIGCVRRLGLVVGAGLKMACTRVNRSGR